MVPWQQLIEAESEERGSDQEERASVKERAGAQGREMVESKWSGEGVQECKGAEMRIRRECKGEGEQGGGGAWELEGVIVCEGECGSKGKRAKEEG